MNIVSICVQAALQTDEKAQASVQQSELVKQDKGPRDYYHS